MARDSVTISDIVYVIDTGLAKSMAYDYRTNVSTLQVDWIAKSSARQRRGRAGRVRPGICFHLFSKARFDSMDEQTLPDLVRSPLDHSCLQILTMLNASKSLSSLGAEFSSLQDFFGAAIDSPSPEMIQSCKDRLVAMGSIRAEEETLTPLGYQLSRFGPSLKVQPSLSGRYSKNILKGWSADTH